MIRRRDFSRLPGRAPLALAIGANAQQPSKMPIIGALRHAVSEKDEEPPFGRLL
jgi:hypothetical protein